MEIVMDIPDMVADYFRHLSKRPFVEQVQLLRVTCMNPEIRNSRHYTAWLYNHRHQIPEIRKIVKHESMHEAMQLAYSKQQWNQAVDVVIEATIEASLPGYMKTLRKSGWPKVSADRYMDQMETGPWPTPRSWYKI
jgi:hypothetical protein